MLSRNWKHSLKRTELLGEDFHRAPTDNNQVRTLTMYTKFGKPVEEYIPGSGDAPHYGVKLGQWAKSAPGKADDWDVVLFDDDGNGDQDPKLTAIGDNLYKQERFIDFLGTTKDRVENFWLGVAAEVRVR
jgi:hypothetical protein